MDGVNAFGFPWCVFGRTPDVEEMELDLPIMIPLSNHWKDSCGHGKYRGGVGTVQIWVTHHVPQIFFMAIADNSKMQTPQPLFGGYAPCTVPGISIRGADIMERMAKGDNSLTMELYDILSNKTIGGEWQNEFFARATTMFNQNDVITFGFATGGSGYGDPLDRDPVVPLIYSFGATCEDLPLDAFLVDPTKISNSLRIINTFFDADGTICCGSERMLSESLRSSCSMADDSFMDPGVKASATLMEAGIERLMGEGRPAVAIEVAKRMGILMPDSIVLAVMAGPVKLASQLTGLSAEKMLQYPNFLSLTTKAILAFLRAMGETGIDMVAIREDAVGPIDAKFSTVLNRCYSPLWNTAKFYGMHALLMPEQFAPENGALYKKMINKVIFPTGTSPEAFEKFRKPSFSIPCSLLEKEMDEIESFLLGSEIIRFLESKKLFLVTTDHEIPGDIDKEKMIEGMKKIKDILTQHGE